MVKLLEANKSGNGSVEMLESVAPASPEELLLTLRKSDELENIAPEGAPLPTMKESDTNVSQDPEKLILEASTPISSKTRLIEAFAVV